jgi:hypothetical protein
MYYYSIFVYVCVLCKYVCIHSCMYMYVYIWVCVQYYVSNCPPRCYTHTRLPLRLESV